MSVLIASDLDRTLIYSLAAAGPTDDELVAVEHLDGRPISYLTTTAARLLAELVAEQLVVPVTTRTPEQLARVHLPGVPSSYAVAANGGVLLVAGVPDRDWDARVRAELASAAPVEEAAAVLEAACDPDRSRPTRMAGDLFCYRVVDRAALAEETLAALQAWAGPAGWRVSLQGRKLYLVPEGLRKSAAVAEIARRTDASTVLAAGDSLLDIDLLVYADRGVRPRHGELQESGWSHPSVQVVDACGVAAGAQILAWFIRVAADRGRARLGR